MNKYDLVHLILIITIWITILDIQFSFWALNVIILS